jgi:cytochrome c556
MAVGLVSAAIALLILDMTSACAQATENSDQRGESIVEQMNPQTRQFPAVRHQRLKSDAIEYSPAVQRPAFQVA